MIQNKDGRKRKLAAVLIMNTWDGNEGTRSAAEGFKELLNKSAEPILS
jgi:hypothetical protein